MSQLATGHPWKSECCLLLPDRGWKISSPLSLFDTSPAGEVEHHNFLPLEKGWISFPLVCLYPQQRNLSITSSGRVARIISSLLSPTKTVVEECDFSCWCLSGLGQELPKRFFVRLPFSWSLARGSRLFLELYCLCLLMVLRGRLLKLPIWEMWEAIRKPGGNRHVISQAQTSLDNPPSPFHLSESSYVCLFQNVHGFSIVRRTWEKWSYAIFAKNGKSQVYFLLSRKRQTSINHLGLKTIKKAEHRSTNVKTK